MGATLYVCTTCKHEGDDPEAPRRGARLAEELLAKGAPEGVTIQPVECLSACKNGCSVALQEGGKWTYVYGRLDPDEGHADDILAGAAAYAATSDGLVPWRERPVIFRKQSIARIPPMLSGIPKL
ncbi:DUF1636 family protein [Pseudaestuariivita sp.]|uniref:DUF1636 family protein n=1 Tax=Pseudaestuariivita sp. TaxID=2211669 RepID=UPI0040589DD4